MGNTARISIAAGAPRGTVSLGSDTSDETPNEDGPVVDAAPTGLNPPTFESTIYACGTSMRIGGLAAGAIVTVKTPNDIASAPANAGYADVVFKFPIPAFSPIIATQNACGITATDQTDRISDRPTALPTPRMDPILECQHAVAIHGILAGSVVTLIVLRNGVTVVNDTFNVDWEDGWLLGLPAFQADDDVQLHVAMTECGLFNWTTTKVRAGAPPPPSAHSTSQTPEPRAAG